MGTTHQFSFLAQQNQLLAALPTADLTRWQSHFQLVELSRNQVLQTAGRSTECVYFPTTAIVSLIGNTRDDVSAEVAVVGNDGVVGISYLLGADRVSNDEMNMTYERAASLLGARRESISAAAPRLQDAGLIRYSRGRNVVLNRKILEQDACDCYAFSKKDCRRSNPLALAA